MGKRAYNEGKFDCHKQKEELTEAELKFGKDRIKIWGTQELMPWVDVYARIAAGMDIKHIAQKYGHERMITLWAEQDGIEPIKDIIDLVDDEIIQRRKMLEVENKNPAIAMTLKEVVNEYAPDVAVELVKLTSSMIRKGQAILDDEDSTTNDMKNIAQAVQTMTDTVEISERFSTNAGTGNINISVPGFSFIEDLPPESIEADIVIEKDESDE